MSTIPSYEKIIGYRTLQRKCDVCGALATIEVTTKITTDNPRNEKGERILVTNNGVTHRTFCAAHSPIDWAAEQQYWLQVATTPPGA